MLEHFYFRLIQPNLSKRIIQCRSLHIMSGILMIIYALQFLVDFRENWMLLLALLPPAMLIIILAIFKKKMITELNNNRVFRILEVGFLFMGCLHYLKTNQFFPASLFGFFASFLLYILYIENRLFSFQYIDVTKDGVAIAMPTHTKKIPWTQIAHIVVKDDYFTIEMRDQQISQYRIHNSLTDEEYFQFVQYCSKQRQVA